MSNEGPKESPASGYEPYPVFSFVLDPEPEPEPEDRPLSLDALDPDEVPVSFAPGVLEQAARAMESDTHELAPRPLESGTHAIAARHEPSAFEIFEAALTRTLLSRGATRAAALLPRLLALEPLPEGALHKDVRITLQSRGYLEGNGRYSPKFRTLCSAWCAVLRGTARDISACGTTTLDRFGAELLAALLAVPATRADELRRDLRKGGVAAFGVVHAAA